MGSNDLMWALVGLAAVGGIIFLVFKPKSVNDLIRKFGFNVPLEPQELGESVGERLDFYKRTGFRGTLPG